MYDESDQDRTRQDEQNIPQQRIPCIRSMIGYSRCHGIYVVALVTLINAYYYVSRGKKALTVYGSRPQGTSLYRTAPPGGQVPEPTNGPIVTSGDE